MPELKLVSTHDAGISPSEGSSPGKRCEPPVFVSVSFLLPLRGQVPVTGRP